jgi:hypothetical protein
MFEACEVCGIKLHSLKVHKFSAPVAVSEVLPVIGDGSTGIKGLGLITPSTTSNKSIEQISMELEDRMGIHNFHGYTIRPTVPVAAKVAEKPKVVKLQFEKIESAYVNFFKHLGEIEYDMQLMGKR